MAAVRGWLRLILFWPLTWFNQAMWGAARLLTLGRPLARRRAHARCTRWWARSTLKLLGVRVRVEGTPPQPPFLLASNHLSYLDVVVFWATFHTCFLAKSEVAAWPLFGRITRSTGNLFVNRAVRTDMRRVVGESVELLQAGYGLSVFAEGTSSPGAEVLPFMPSLFQTAVQCGLPVHTAAIRYQVGPHDDPAHHSVCWWGDMEFMPHFRLMVRQSRIEACVRFGAAPVHGDNRRSLARASWEQVDRDFEPVVSHEQLEREGGAPAN